MFTCFYQLYTLLQLRSKSISIRSLTPPPANITIHLMDQRKRSSLLDDFAAPSKGSFTIKNFSIHAQYLKCICQDDDEVGLTCFKCRSYTHHCIERAHNRGDKYECASCISKSMDPIFTVRKVFVESYFKTCNIFEFHNQISFQFMVGVEDMFHPVEVRGLKPGWTSLSWPMQGTFYINDDPCPVHQLRPLRQNSNRKTRRQEFFTIPKKKVRPGKNYIRFKIPVIDRSRFTNSYQYEDTGVYFMSINSIEALSQEQLIAETFQKRRLQKEDSIALLSQTMGDIQVTQNKICLICPYTRNRIKIPVRGRYCKHFTCVCLETLIASHYHSRFWGCPICDAKISEPYVDRWIYYMLTDNTKGTDIIVQQDGTYSWVTHESNQIDLDSEDSFIAPRPKQNKNILEIPISQSMKNGPPLIPIPLQQSCAQVQRVDHPPVLQVEQMADHRTTQRTSSQTILPNIVSQDNFMTDEIEEIVGQKSDQIKRLVLEALKSKMTSILSPETHETAQILIEDNHTNISTNAHLMTQKPKMEKKQRSILCQIKQSVCKKVSYQNLKLKCPNMLKQKKVDLFLKEYPNLNYLYRQVLQS